MFRKSFKTPNVYKREEAPLKIRRFGWTNLELKKLGLESKFLWTFINCQE